jgi:hypothetical protein
MSLTASLCRLSLWPGDMVSSHLPLERPSVNAERHRGAAYVPAVELEAFIEMPFFDLFKAR